MLYLFVYKSQNFALIIHLESQVATYTQDMTYTHTAWMRAWWLV